MKIASLAALLGFALLLAMGCGKAAQPTAGASASAQPALASPAAARAAGTTLTPAQEQAAVPNAKTKPNVLIILADDLGWSDIGCYGSEVQTPNLDALAADGLRFTQFYNNARCSPTRAAILTGLDPHQVGVPLLGTPLNDQCVTLPEVLKPAGYNTYMVGKWHLSEQITPVMRGFDEFYGMLGGFNTYWEEHPYQTRLPEGHPRRTYAPGTFYTTNAFGDYALDFMNQGRAAGKPWFMYLAFNAAHFPLGAPEATIQKYEALYRAKGWDAIRADRLAKEKKLGLVPQDLALTPRGTIPPNFINVKTGWANKEIPAWDSLPADRQADLARRMAVYAAAIDIMDQNIGRIVAHLKETGEWKNTAIFFLSDNGGCAEWDPYGFDKLDSTLNIVHKGEDLKKVGSPDSYVSYGTGWANASDTPWRLYKHYTQEGGIRTPLIVHWPDGLKTKGGALTGQPGFVTDFMPTIVELTGAKYPTQHNGVAILPTEGESIAPTFNGTDLAPRTLCVEHEGNRMVRESDWKLVALRDKPWELYDLSKDPSEMNDMAQREPDRVKKMSADWTAWAERTNVLAKAAAQSPQIANHPITIRCDATPAGGGEGVLVAQGGNMRGYAVYVQDGKLIFGVREKGKLVTIATPRVPTSHFSVEAKLEKSGAMTLLVNGKVVAQGHAPGLILEEPNDGLTIGEDTLSPVGEYKVPNHYHGKVENVKVETGTGGATADTAAEPKNSAEAD